MCQDQRPQLSPSPINEPVKQLHYKHENESTDTHGRMQEPAKHRRCQNRDPHAMSLQCLKEKAAFQRFLKDGIHDADENDERERQLTDAMKIHGRVKDPGHQETQKSTYRR